MRVITLEEWRRLWAQGYGRVGRDGQRWALVLDRATGGTVLVPVEVE